MFDNLVELENSLTISTKTALVYIAGYVTRKDEELSEKDLLDVTTFYFEKYGSYTVAIALDGGISFGQYFNVKYDVT